jgi:hypothetical protein
MFGQQQQNEYKEKIRGDNGFSSYFKIINLSVYDVLQQIILA